MSTAPDEASWVDPYYVFDLVAIGDSKVAFSSWCFSTVFNSRAIADIATLLALGGASLGHARAIYQRLGEFGHDYGHLERGREASEVNSIQLLDAPPTCWEDLIATVLVAENALWALASGFVGGRDSQIGMLIHKIGRERRFHVLYAMGWLGAFDDEERTRFRLCLDDRIRSGRQWLGPDDGDDVTEGSGFRTTTNRQLHELFESGMRQPYEALGVSAPPPTELPPEWNRTRRRFGSVPDGLYRQMMPREL